MTKRKCEDPQQLLANLLPPCKRPLHCFKSCNLDVVPVRKRRLEPESAPLLQAVLPAPECDRVLPPSSPPPCKKLRVAAESLDYKCQKDEAFSEYNSFQYWRTPLPAVDLSELIIEAGDITTGNTAVVTEVQEMDS